MAIQIVAPNARGIPGSWQHCGVDWLTCVQTSNDTYISTNVDATSITFTFPALPAGILDPVNSCQFKAEAKKNLTGSPEPKLRIYKGASWSPDINLTINDTVKSVSADSLVVATINGYSTGVYFNKNGAADDKWISVDYVYRETDYTMAAGCTVVQHLAPHIGVNPDDKDWVRMAPFLFAVAGIILSPAEWRAERMAWKAGRRPKFAFFTREPREGEKE